jgi:(p)ppGpp synthase/HD superfamily hydrolase
VAQVDIVNRAIEFAAKAHRHQVRKGTDTPYITHPYAIGLMLTRAGFDPEVVAAGLLHDTVEDTDVTPEDILEEFGERVASIVEGASEPNRGARWEERKEHTIEYLRTAPYEVRAVACADKLHNLTTIADDYILKGRRVESVPSEPGSTGMVLSKSPGQFVQARPAWTTATAVLH